jgi:hypothetical protein
MGETEFQSLQQASAAAGIERSGPRVVSRTDLDVAATIVPNTIGAGRATSGGPPVAMLLDGLVAPQEAAELIRVSEALGFRQIVKNISDNYDQTLPSRTHLRCIIHNQPLAVFAWTPLHFQREKCKIYPWLAGAISFEIQKFFAGLPCRTSSGRALFLTSHQSSSARGRVPSEPCVSTRASVRCDMTLISSSPRYDAQKQSATFRWPISEISDRLPVCASQHTDTVYRSRDGVSEVSFLTVVLYLNDGFDGGELRFLRNRQDALVTTYQSNPHLLQCTYL